jgi:hypothetical protein
MTVSSARDLCDLYCSYIVGVILSSPSDVNIILLKSGLHSAWYGHLLFSFVLFFPLVVSVFLVVTD